VIKIRVEGKENQIAQVVEILREHFQDLEITGIYEIPQARSRAYIDIENSS
jgi:hypothetical protein